MRYLNVEGFDICGEPIERKVRGLRAINQPLRKRLVSRFTVSREFRELTLETFPALKDNPVYMRLMQFLLFGTFTDVDTGRRVISQEILWEIEGGRGSIGNFKAEKLLLDFQREVMSPETFGYSDWIVRIKARQVTKFILPVKFFKALDDEFRKVLHCNGRVYFCDGSLFSAKNHKKIRDEKKAAADAYLNEALNPVQIDILQYLNNLPPHLFTKLVNKNYGAAVEVAMGSENEIVRLQQLRLLNSIREDPKAFYAPSRGGKTVRLFEMGGGITNLKREVREALTAGWHEADIKSSQLSICAALWRVEEIQNFLKRGGSIWEHLADHFNLVGVERSVAKPALKEALYSCCYGMDRQCIAKRLTAALKKLGIIRDGKHFLNSPLIQPLLAARDAAIDKIKRDGGAVDCFGKKLILSERKHDARKILAQIAQAIELKLIYPVFQLAKNTTDFKVMILQHDGAMIHFLRRETRWKKQLESVVCIEAQRMGIVTGLEWKR